LPVNNDRGWLRCGSWLLYDYRWLLRRNHHEPYNARFSIGPDGDIYLTGRVLYQHLDEEELDRLIGVCYETVETWFQTAITLGFR